MNLSAVCASRAAGAFVPQVGEEADPACHSYPRARVNEPRRTAKFEKAPVNNDGHRQVNRAHSSVPVVAQYTSTALVAPPRASGARHPESVSALIHIV
jgi:hypothetical protein